MQWQLQNALQRLDSAQPETRAGALEQLGLMRAYSQAARVAGKVVDSSPAVRRQAVMALGWLGDGNSVDPLLRALSDPDWTVRQSAAVSLQNVTAVPFAFDALASPEARAAQVAVWREQFKARDVCAAALEALSDPEMDFFQKADLVRAAGTFGCGEIEEALVAALRPYLTKSYPPDNAKRLYTPASPAVDSRPERAFVQAGLRALGRLGGKTAVSFLIEVLQGNEDWACYAAEALGDCGGAGVVEALLQAAPKYCFNLKHGAHFTSYSGVVEKFPKHDAPKLSASDRIPRTAYEILNTLCRLDLSGHRDALVEISPYILASIPNMWDATVVYSEEPWAMIFGYLLDKAGMRRQMRDAAFISLKVGERSLPEPFALRGEFLFQAGKNLEKGKSQFAPYAGQMLVCCAEAEDIPLLVELLTHDSGWIRLEAAKALALLDAQEAADPIIRLLEAAKDDADYPYGMDFHRYVFNLMNWKRLPGEGYDELGDPSPRFKEGYLRALGLLRSEKAVPVLVRYLNNERNANEIKHAAALALADVASPDALAALREAEAEHPVATVQVAAREALWRHGVRQKPIAPADAMKPVAQLEIPTGLPRKLVFIKGERELGNNDQISKDMTAYSVTDSGPTYRLGSNIYSLDTAAPEGSLRQLTHFTSGYVADLEVSFDGQKLLFTHNTMDPEPWYHIYEMNADGAGLKQLTFGPYHDVHPNFMPDGRIVFTTSRSGMRDEYHGYPANGLAVMNADGSDIRVIGLNIGRDAEPVIGDNGKILFTRLELFYSRMKTEWNLLTAFPDGRSPLTLYGPERRELHRKIPGAMAMAPPRHRVLRLTQPQSWRRAEHILNTHRGPMVVGPGRSKERFLRPDNTWAVTTPYKISDEVLLVAAGKRPVHDRDIKVWGVVKKGQPDPYASVDHGLYWMDAATGELTLIYNDPETADFEARPLQPRKVPPVLPDSPLTRERSFSGQLFCASAFITQDPHVKERGKYVRVIEGLPMVARHQTHTSGGVAWRNHGGSVARVFGTVPLAADGSFALEIPADRLFHLQVLDSDRRVVGNELNWQHLRPRETRSCIGCHERPDDAPSATTFPLAHKLAPVQCFPNGDEMQYRAKLWFKGWAPDEREERMRTVNSVNIFGRN